MIHVPTNPVYNVFIQHKSRESATSQAKGLFYIANDP